MKFSPFSPVTLAIFAFSTLFMASGGFAQSVASPRQRINIDDDWRFIKSDPSDVDVSLTYPRVLPARRGAVATAPSVDPTSGIAAYILPTGNAFIADVAKRYTKPAGNYGGDISYVKADFDDSSWRHLDLPHDFAIEGPFVGPGQPGSDGATGRLPFYGTVWYRKHLSVPAEDAGKRVFLDIDGAMSYATVWCNGQIVGGWPYGYASWRVDLTAFVKTGAENVLAIRLDNPPNSSRWYPGGGIYRHVWLTVTSPVHVGEWGTYVTTPQVTEQASSVALDVTVDNNADSDAAVQVASDIFELDSAGQRSASPVASIAAVAGTIGAGQSTTLQTSGSVANPKLWSPNSPNRYVAVTTVTRDGAVVDAYETPFGIRTLKYDPNAGLFINGEHFKINGVCDHHDLGALGTAVNVRALQRQLQLLRDMGCNALRTSHNPPAPELLEFADELGMVVMDEAFDTWGSNKRPNDYGGGNLFHMWHEQDLRAQIRRDRNHPSVIMWSIGNEIQEQAQGANSPIAKELAGIVHSEDPTRAVAAACNNANSMNNGFNTLLDAMGFNYKPDKYIPFHEQFPNQFFFASESVSTVSSRGEYYFPVVGPGFGGTTSGPRGGRGARGAAPAGGQAAAPATRRGPAYVALDNARHEVSSYDLYYSSWATSPDHEFFGQDHSPAVAGEFVWTGFDYLGEPTPWGGGNDPSRSSYYGIIDLAGFLKDRYYLYQAHWRPDFPMAHILPHWNWPERVGQVTPVHVYTSGDEAELFLNGKSLGRKKKVFDGATPPELNGQPAYRIRWDDVVYEPGELKVVAYKDGKEWATDTVKTTGPAAQLLLQPDRTTIANDGHDLSFVTLKVSDSEGLMVPRSMNPVHFQVSGPGVLVATDNGDPTDLTIFSQPDRKAFNGLALAIVKAQRGQSGTITVTATSDGLTAATATIEAK